MEVTVIESKLAILKKKIENHGTKPEVRKQNPIGILEKLIIDKQDVLTRNRYSQSVPLAAYYDNEKLVLMKTLMDIIVDLDSRLVELEQKP
jgi:hypothetical protein